MSSLRSAIAFAVSTTTWWTAAEIATTAGTSPQTAASYLGRLMADGVVIRDDEHDGYRAGPNAKEWRLARPKTNPGGNSKEYLAAKSIRDEIRAREWRESRGRGILTGQDTTPCDSIRPDTTGGDTMPEITTQQLAEALTVAEASDILGVSRRTIERWMSSGKLQGFRFAGIVRIPRSNLMAMAVVR